MRLSHDNKKIHNLLFYYINEGFIKKNECYYKGVIYDLGCGNKPYKDYFESQCENYIGIDIKSDNYLNCADLFFDLNEHIDVESNIADVVLSLSVIEHLRTPQIMLNEAYRILKNNGVMILQAPFQWKIHDAPYDYFRYTKFGLEKMLEEAGFKSYRIEEEMGLFSMLALKSSYFLYKFVKGPKLIRGIIHILFLPIWIILQFLGCLIDSVFPYTKDETLGYFVVAKK